MSQINVTRREFARAYRAHKNAIKRLDSTQYGPYHLLLFYAVECGIKTVLLREFNADCFDSLSDEAKIGHDIKSGLRILRIDSTFSLKDLTKKRDSNRKYPPGQLNQAFRYGVHLNKNELMQFIQTMKEILDWLEKEI